MGAIKRLWLVWALMAILASPAVVQAQLVLATNGNTISVTGYTDSPTAVTIPATTNGLPVTSIGTNAFFNCSSLTSVTVGTGVTDIGGFAFWNCTNLTGIYFQGNAPGDGSNSTVFHADTNATVYYLPGTTNWGSTFDGLPTATYGIWSGAECLTNDWYWLDWFGHFNTAYYPWVYHLQHGWMYPVGTDSTSIWLWTSDMDWLWTSDTIYPYLYRYSDAAWLWYLKDSFSPRWFYNFKTDKWEQH